MDYQQFLVALRETPRDWFVTGGCLRRPIGIFLACPITTFGAQRATRYPAAARELGLSSDLAYGIALAADGCGDSSIRADLLAACGLEAPR